MAEPACILTRNTAEKKLRRMALEILERNHGEKAIVLAGIKGNGIVIAGLISRFLSENYTGSIILAELIIDKRNPGTVTVKPDIDVKDKVIIIVDDVANSGRTMLYSLRPFLETHPRKIQTLALVERTHKSFPVEVDYIGQSVSTTLDEHITVEVEAGEVTGAWINK